MGFRKAVIITGASSGIGKALAVCFAHNGYNVTLAARNREKLEATGKLCTARDAQTLVIPADVSSDEECRKLIKQSREHFGRIDVLINNAGISMRGLFKDTSPEVFKQLMDVNFWGTYYCTHYALPHLIESGGTLVGVSSIAGYRGLPARSAYSASKFAMHGLLESIRTENYNNGLKVLIAAPGFTASNIRNQALGPDGNIQKESPLDESKIMPAEKVAEKIFRAVKNEKKYLTLSFEGKLAVWINKVFPGWLDKLLYSRFAKETGSPLIKHDKNEHN